MGICTRGHGFWDKEYVGSMAEIARRFEMEPYHTRADEVQQTDNKADEMDARALGP